MRKDLRNVWVCLAICMATPAMAQQVVFEALGDNMSATAISPNGRWIGLNMPGDLGTNIECYLYDTETQKMTQMNTAYEINIAHAKAISPGGLPVGCYGMDDLKAPAAYYYADEWNLLPVPQDRSGTGAIAFAVSDDETLIGGEIEGITIGKPALPCVWKRGNNEYEVEVIPHPELDITGSIPQGGGVKSMSADGSVLVGTMYDWTGFASVLIVWTKGEDGYAYKIYGEDIAYNVKEENPGQFPEYEEYVTTNPGDPEYNEQYKKWQQLSNTYYDLRDKFYTGETLLSEAFISPNGRYVALNIRKTIGGGEEADWMTYPYRIDLQTGEEIWYEESPNVIANNVLDDGSIVAFESAQYIEKACIFLQNSTSAVKMEDWMKNKFGMDIPEDLIFEEGVITGYPIVSADASVIAGTFAVPGIWANYTYYMRYAPSSVRAAQATDRVSVCVTGKCLDIQGVAEWISLVDLAGKIVYSAPVNGSPLDISSLPEGVYIARLLSDGEIVTCKIVY